MRSRLTRGGGFCRLTGVNLVSTIYGASPHLKRRQQVAVRVVEPRLTVRPATDRGLDLAILVTHEEIVTARGALDRQGMTGLVENDEAARTRAMGLSWLARRFRSEAKYGNYGDTARTTTGRITTLLSPADHSVSRLASANNL